MSTRNEKVVIEKSQLVPSDGRGGPAGGQVEYSGRVNDRLKKFQTNCLLMARRLFWARQTGRPVNIIVSSGLVIDVVVA